MYSACNLIKHHHFCGLQKFLEQNRLPYLYIIGTYIQKLKLITNLELTHLYMFQLRAVSYWSFSYTYTYIYHYIYTFCVYLYVYISIHLFVNFYTLDMHYSPAFSQPATGPSSVCEGSDVTLQCRVVFNDNPRDSVWYRNGTLVRMGGDFIPNHNVIFNSTTGVRTDLVITDVTLEDDNTVYSCTDIGDSIASSVVLNVAGKLYPFTYCDYICQT